MTAIREVRDGTRPQDPGTISPISDGMYLNGHQVPRLTGERPTPGATPDSLIALHAAGYREVNRRVGQGLVIDMGCGLGFESIGLADTGRNLIGIDYDPGAAIQAHHRWSEQGFSAACMDAACIAIRDSQVDWICSSHLIEHFRKPAMHVAEVSRVLKSDGTAFFIAPNAPADFENPFHVTSFEARSLAGLLGQYFTDVWVGGLDGTPAVKQDIGSRRLKANRLLSLDFLRLRHKMPYKWYVGIYTKVLPVVYRIIARRDSGGSTGITEQDFAVVNEVDSRTLALFAIAKGPRRLES